MITAVQNTAASLAFSGKAIQETSKTSPPIFVQGDEKGYRLADPFLGEDVKRHILSVEDRGGSHLRIVGRLPSEPTSLDIAKQRDAGLDIPERLSRGKARRGLLLCEFEQMAGVYADSDGKVAEKVKISPRSLVENIVLIVSDLERQISLCSFVESVVNSVDDLPSCSLLQMTPYLSLNNTYSLSASTRCSFSPFL